MAATATDPMACCECVRPARAGTTCGACGGAGFRTDDELLRLADEARSARRIATLLDRVSGDAYLSAEDAAAALAQILETWHRAEDHLLDALRRELVAICDERAGRGGI